MDALREAAREAPGLRLLVLTGSRARGQHHERSDWDLAYRSDAEFDGLGFLDRATRLLRTDDVDLVDLDRASALFRVRAADEGVLLHEEREGEWLDFAISAAIHWCDIEPIVRGVHDALLAR